MQGDIQQLLIIDDPSAAETYCQDYIPDCDAPLPYNSILTEPEEVSPKGQGELKPASTYVRLQNGDRITWSIPHAPLRHLRS